MLFSAVNDKDVNAMIKNIAENTNFTKIYITQIEGGRCLAANVIAQIFKEYVDIPVEVYEDNETAFITAYNDKNDDDVLFCAGSLYLAGNILKIIRKMEDVQ